MSIPLEEIEEEPKYHKVLNCCLKIAQKRSILFKIQIKI
jgi:hypothetical protein